MCVAISGVSGAPSATIRSNTISPHAAADRSIQFSAPNPVLPGWWSMLMTKPRASPSTPGRVMSPHSIVMHRVAGIVDARRHLDQLHAGQLAHGRRRRVRVHDAHLLAERA